MLCSRLRLRLASLAAAWIPDGSRVAPLDHMKVRAWKWGREGRARYLALQQIRGLRSFRKDSNGLDQTGWLLVCYKPHRDADHQRAFASGEGPSLASNRGHDEVSSNNNNNNKKRPADRFVHTAKGLVLGPVAGGSTPRPSLT